MSKLGYHPLAATFVSAHVSESCLAQESTRFIISPQFAKRLGFSRDRLSAWHTTAWIQGEWSGATDNCLGEEKMFKIWKSIIGKLRVTCCVSTTSGPLKFDLGQNDNIAILKALDEEDPVEIQKYIIELLSCRFFIYFKIEPLVTRVRHWVQCEIFWLFFFSAMSCFTLDTKLSSQWRQFGSVEEWSLGWQRLFVEVFVKYDLPIPQHRDALVIRATVDMWQWILLVIKTTTVTWIGPC